MITAGAAVMVAVFGAFAISGNRTLAMFALAMASAVFLDALVVRMLLLPAVLQLLSLRSTRSHDRRTNTRANDGSLAHRLERIASRSTARTYPSVARPHARARQRARSASAGQVSSGSVERTTCTPAAAKRSKAASASSV